jgi:hypothetical protein
VNPVDRVSLDLKEIDIEMDIVLGIPPDLAVGFVLEVEGAVVTPLQVS